MNPYQSNAISIQSHLKGARNFYSNQLGYITGKLEHDLTLIEHLRDFLKKKIEIERDYYDRLEKLAKSTQKQIVKGLILKPSLENPSAHPTPPVSSAASIISNTSSSTSTPSRESVELLLNFINLTEKKAQHGTQLLDQMGSPLLEKLRDFTKQKSFQSQKYFEGWKLVIEKLMTCLSELNDAKNDYEMAVKAYEQIDRKQKDTLQGRSTGVLTHMKLALSTMSEEQRLAKIAMKVKLAHQRMTQARNTYVLHLTAYNTSQHQFWDAGLPDFVSLIEKGIDTTYLSAIQTYTQSDLRFNVSMNELMQNLHQQSQSIDFAKQRLHFFQEHDHYFHAKSIYPFEPYSNDTCTDFVCDIHLKGEVASKLSDLVQQKVLILDKLNKAKKELTGLEQMAKVYETTPDFGDATTTLDNKLNLEVSTIILENQLKQYEEQIKILEEATSKLPNITYEVVNLASAPVAPVEPDPVVKPTTVVTAPVETKPVILSTAKVMYAFDSTVEGGLSVEVGQTLNVLEGDTDGWTKVELNGRTGYVPSNYIELVQASTSVGSAPKAVPVVSEPIVAAPVASAPVNYAPVVSEPVVYAPVVTAPVVSEPVISAPVMAAPIQNPFPTSTPSVMIPPPSQPPSPMSEELRVVALLDYPASNPSEISMAVGDTLLVLHQPKNERGQPSEWWTGRNLRTKKEGLFPSLFTEEISNPIDTPMASFSSPNTTLKREVQQNYPQQQQQQRPTKEEKVQALYDYQPLYDGELDLRVGDVIIVTMKDTGSEGWWFGTNLSTNQQGQFPKDYTAPLS